MVLLVAPVAEAEDPVVVSAWSWSWSSSSLWSWSCSPSEEGATRVASFSPSTQCLVLSAFVCSSKDECYLQLFIMRVAALEAVWNAVGIVSGRSQLPLIATADAVNVLAMGVAVRHLSRNSSSTAGGRRSSLSRRRSKQRRNSDDLKGQHIERNLTPRKKKLDLLQTV